MSRGGKKGISSPLRLILWLNFFLIGSLLLAYLSSYIDPSLFPYIAPAGMGYLPLLMTNIVFILFWLYFAPRKALYSILAIVLGTPVLLAHFQLNRRADRTAGDLRILSYNVRNFFNYLPDATHPESQEEKVRNFIKEQHPDIVCMQEFMLKDRLLVNDKKRFGKKIGLRYYYAHKYLNRKSKARVGLITYSRFPIVGEDFIEYQGKTFGLITKIRTDKDTITVYNLHLASIHFGDDDYRFLQDIRKQNSKEDIQKASGRIIQKMIKAFRIRGRQVALLTGLLHQTSGSIILCGDFNDTPLSYTYHEVSSILKDSFCEAGRGLATTFDLPYLPPARIDYIFHSDDYRATEFQVIKRNFSDHYPVQASLYKTEKEEE